MSWYDHFDCLDEIPSNKPILDHFTSYFKNSLELNGETIEPKPETFENNMEVNLPYFNSSTDLQADVSFDQNTDDEFVYHVSISPQEPSEGEKLTIPITNIVEKEKRKRKARSSKANDYSDDSNSNEIAKPKKVKNAKDLEKNINIPEKDKILKEFKPYGETKKCIICNETYDKNYMFIYSEDRTTAVDNKPFICLFCSAYINNDQMLRDWDMGLKKPFKCYRCNHMRSDGRRKKIGSYCYYCSLKKKRVYKRNILLNN